MPAIEISIPVPIIILLLMHERVIIVGGTSGIGRRLAELYAAKGCRVGVTGRRCSLLDELREQFPGQIETSCFDVTSQDPVARLEDLVTALGGMDILIISAGTGEPSKELKWEIDERVLKTNTVSFIRIANWAFNYFVFQNSGKLATISSVAANRGSGWAPAYAASKAFQSTYFEGLALKARKLATNVSVTTVEPGFVNTKMAHGGDRMFWIVPVDKAARQILRAIERNRRKVYVSRRWWLVAKLMRWTPYWIYRRLGS